MTNEVRRERGARDVELARRAASGERSAIRALAQRMRCVSRFLRVRNERSGRPLSRDDLDDVAQDALLVIWRKLEHFAGASELEAWVYRIVAFEFSAAMRKKLRRDGRSVGDGDGTEHDAEPVLTRDPWEFEDVHLALRRIGREEAHVVRVKHFEGLTFEEIAERLGQSPNTVKAKYYRGMKELRPLLESRRVLE